MAEVRHRSRSRSPGLLPTPEATALYVSYPRPVSLPRDSEFFRIFGMFGPLKRVFVHRSPRIYAIVDFERMQDAAKALEHLNGDNSRLRALLGDSRLSLTFKKTKPPPKPDWTGQLQVSGHRAISVLAKVVEGQIGTVLAGCSQLTANHIVSVTVPLAQEARAVVVFTGAEEEACRGLREVGTWLYAGQKAGLAHTQGYSVYLLPPGPDAGRFTPVASDQLVGVLASP